VSTEAFLKIPAQHQRLHRTATTTSDDDKHAKEKPAVASRRAYALSINEGCKDCHKKHVAQFKDSGACGDAQGRQRQGAAVLGLPRGAHAAVGEDRHAGCRRRPA